MKRYQVTLIKHFEIKVEVLGENAIMAERRAMNTNPGYKASAVRWLDQPIVPEVAKIRKPRKTKPKGQVNESAISETN